MSVIKIFMISVTKLNEYVGRCIALIVFPMFACLIIEVFLRYFLNSPSIWTNELTQLMFGVYAVMSGGYLMAHRGHVNVDLLHSKLKLRVQGFVDIFTSIIFFCFILALVYFSFDMASESFGNRESSFSAWNPPIWPAKGAIFIASLLMLLQGIVRLLEDIAIAFNLSYYDPKERNCYASTEEGEAQ